MAKHRLPAPGENSVLDTMASVAAATCAMKTRYDRKGARKRCDDAIRHNVLLRRYQCARCGGWHVTGKSRQKYLRTREAWFREALDHG